MIEIDTKHIEEQIVSRAAYQIEERLISEEKLVSVVHQRINERIDQIFVGAVDERIKASIEQAINDGFNREYRKTDSFGKATGDPTTISKELERQIQNYWTQTVDMNGKVAERNSYSKIMTRAEWHMSRMVAADFSEEMKQHIANVSGGFKDQLRSELRGTLDRLLSEILRVKTPGDKA